MYKSSSLLVGLSIYVFGGMSSLDFPIQRIDLVEEEIAEIEIIGSQPYSVNYPVLFETTFDFCK